MINLCECARCRRFVEADAGGIPADQDHPYYGRFICDRCLEHPEIQPDQIKPEFCRIRSVFKSLYHDLLPDLDITLQCSILPDNDMVEVCRRVRMRHTTSIRRSCRKKWKRHTVFSVCGTWDTEPDQD